MIYRLRASSITEYSGGHAKKCPFFFFNFLRHHLCIQFQAGLILLKNIARRNTSDGIP